MPLDVDIKAPPLERGTALWDNYVGTVSRDGAPTEIPLSDVQEEEGDEIENSVLVQAGDGASQNQKT